MLVLGRREAMDKSQRTDGESTATGSTTPSANSSSSLSSAGHEISANVDHTVTSSHHLVGCSTVTNAGSNGPRSDSPPGRPPAHPSSYSQQPLALTGNSRLNNHKSIPISDNYRQETFPINSSKKPQQHLVSSSDNGASM